MRRGFFFRRSHPDGGLYRRPALTYPEIHSFVSRVLAPVAALVMCARLVSQRHSSGTSSWGPLLSAAALPVTLYFSRIMLQCMLYQLLLNGLSSTTFRPTNTLPTRRISILLNMFGQSSSNSFTNSARTLLTPPAVPMLYEPDW